MVYLVAPNETNAQKEERIEDSKIVDQKTLSKDSKAQKKLILKVYYDQHHIEYFQRELDASIVLQSHKNLVKFLGMKKFTTI